MLSLTRDKGEHARQAQLARAASKKDNTSSLPAKKAPVTAEPEDDPYDFGGANTTDNRNRHALFGHYRKHMLVFQIDPHDGFPQQWYEGLSERQRQLMRMHLA